MPSAPHIAATPLRSTRTAVAQPSGGTPLPQRTPDAPARPGDVPAVLVVHDGGMDGRAALDWAIRSQPGTLAILHAWTGVDPLTAARLGGVPAAGAEVLDAVHAHNERARVDAERACAEAVAIAQEAGRTAIPVVRRGDRDAAASERLVRELVARDAVGHVVVPAERRSRWRRLLDGPSAAERLAGDPPCPCTVVPAGAPGT